MQEGQKPKDPTHTMQWLLFVRSHIGQNLLNHFALSSPFPFNNTDARFASPTNRPPHPSSSCPR
ncbi:hypothetical protein JHK82_041665 [Glycine max]|uniref:Uncharacterized protein n=2 Tax=Glycine subgen. Soja TaxID=1462606 RepID=K7MA69_SOYBN|nr:hypothetical protein JHK87_041621 [Glycine soja]KAG4948480.1 hypothetical protein JHK86_041719 [Glycine max]KAG4955952.1 hypothetical protein JHK85_042332 [Glycine max]KAG5104695.1 hypothetical protein JHK82_041665 [Glycine max]KAG5115821.1 hypothetical protein JHK84_041934 [Glycine max]